MKKFILCSLGIALVCWIISGALLASVGKEGFEQISSQVIKSKLLNLGTKIEEFDAVEEQPVSSLNEIVISGTDAAVELSPSPDSRIHLEYLAGDQGPLPRHIEGAKIKFNLENYFKGSNDHLVLHIFDQDHNMNIGSFDTSRIKFKIPQNIKIVRFKSESGDLKSIDISGDLLQFESSSGQVKLSKAHFSRLDLSSVSGDVSLQGSTENADVKTISGEVKIFSENSEPKMKIKTTSGDIKVIFSDEPGVTVGFETTSGSISMRDGHTKIESVDNESDSSESSSKVGSSKKKKTYHLGSAKGQLDVKTVSGDFKLRTGSSEE